MRAVTIRILIMVIALGGVSFFNRDSVSKVIVVPKVETRLDITYAESANGGIEMDVAWPVEGGPYPVIVYFHGGAWTIGDKMLFRHRMRVLAQSGYAVFNANYRLAPNYRFPAQVNDALGAVVFAKEHAGEFNGDPSRVAVMGDSAGAHLAAMAAFAWDDPFFKPNCIDPDHEADGEVQAAILMYGAYRLDWLVKADPRLWGLISTKPYVFAFMGGTLEQKPEEYLKASPASYLDRDSLPAVFILCGADDAVFSESEWLYEKLQEKGVEHTAVFVHDARHEFNYREARRDFPFLRAILDFLDEELENHKM